MILVEHVLVYDSLEGVVMENQTNSVDQKEKAIREMTGIDDLYPDVPHSIYHSQ